MGQPVFLVGTPAEIGCIQGKLQRAFLQERLGRVLARAEAMSTLPLLQQRADKFSEVLSARCPQWLEEASSIASEAGIETQYLLALNCLPANFWGKDYSPAPLEERDVMRAKAQSRGRELISPEDAQAIEIVGGGGDCTTFFALPEAALAGETLLHKNRDEADEVQSVFIKQCDNYYRYISGNDIGNLGIAHCHTEHFWAGANNTGSQVAPDEYSDCALSDAHALRYFAENCAGLDDIVPAIEVLIEAGALGGGGFERGSIFLFANEERGLVIEATSRRFHHEFYDGDAMPVRTNHFIFEAMQEFGLPPHPGSVARFERATQMWQEEDGFASIPSCGEIARDRQNAPFAICRNPSDNLGGSATVSTSTATISSSDDRRSQTHFRNCHPSYAPGIILTPIDRVSDSELVSGQDNQHWRNYRGWV